MDNLKIYRRELPDDQYTSWQHRGDKVEDIKVKDEHVSNQTHEDDFNQFSTF